MTDHLVRLSLDASGWEEEAISDFDSEISDLASALTKGEFDGWEISDETGKMTLWFYGPDAVSLYQEVYTRLRHHAVLRGEPVYLRLGPPEDPDAPEYLFRFGAPPPSVWQ